MLLTLVHGQALIGLLALVAAVLAYKPESLLVLMLKVLLLLPLTALPQLSLPPQLLARSLLAPLTAGKLVFGQAAVLPVEWALSLEPLLVSPLLVLLWLTLLALLLVLDHNPMRLSLVILELVLGKLETGQLALPLVELELKPEL